MRTWRNWKTRKLEGLVGEIPCGFKSHRPHMEIENIKPEDVDKIVEIEMESFPRDDIFEKGDLIRFLKEFPEGCFVAKKDGEVLGYGISKIEKEDGVIVSLAIRKDFRRRGVGSEILKRIIEVFERHKRKRILLHVNETNVEAISLYLNFGFQKEKRIKNYYKNGDTGILMVKKMGG